MAQISTKSIVKQRTNREVSHELGLIHEEMVKDNSQFREALDAYTKQVLALDNMGWKPLSEFFPEEMLGLDERKELSAKAREKAKTDPLIKSGLELRCNYIFGKGAPIEGNVPPRFQKIIDDAHNQRVLFSVQAQLKKERLLYTDGVVLTIWNKAESKFDSMPFRQIADIFYNPDSPSEIWYYLREYSVEEISASSGARSTRTEKYWVPVDSYTPKAKHPRTILDSPVRSDLVMIDGAVNNDDDEALGIGDCIAALPWTWAYAEGLRDDLKLRKSLASIAWLVKQKSAKGAAKAGATIATKGRSAGQTAVAAEGTELQSMPKAGSINSTELRPIASQAASALGVSTVALTRDSGAASGSNAAETTLDTPSAQSAIARQEFWRWYYQRCFQAMGVTGKLPSLNFPKVQDQPSYRVQQGLAMALEKGGISQQEYRVAVAESLDLMVDPADLPKPSPWTGTKRNFWTDEPETGSAGEDNPDALPGQGNSGDVGALDDTNDARANGEFDA